MPVSIAQIDGWRRLPTEAPGLEFKEAKNQFDNKKLYEYCVAIANEGGGHLILGVADTLPRPVVGTRAFNNPVEMAEKIFQALGFRVDIEELSHPDGRILVFIIPNRPRGAAFSLDGSYLMRCGQQLVPMSDDRLRKIFLEGEPAWLEEPTEHANIKEAEVLRLLDAASFFRLMRLPYPSASAGVIDRFLMEKLIDEEADGTFTIRRMGALLFANDINSFLDVKRKTARVVVYDGPGKVSATKWDRSAIKGYAAGFQALVRFINNQLPQNEVIKDALRTETKLVPEVAVRELVANALIHQDFGVGGSSVMIEMYNNRLEISNPGTPVVPVDRFIDAYQSRNERLADLMRRMGICEEKSSGIDKVVQMAEMYQLPAPDFRVMEKRTVVTIHGPKPFADMDREERMRACYQHCALKWVMDERMTNQSLRGRFHAPTSKTAIVSQVIAAAIDAGQIKPDERAGSSRRFARYVPHWA